VSEQSDTLDGGPADAWRRPAEPLAVPRALLVRDVNGYSTKAAGAKQAMHLAGARFLEAVAQRLGLSRGEYDIRSNPGGVAVSGEVTLHSDDLYVQLSESCVGPPGLKLLYRSCGSRTDYCGNQNHFVAVRDLRGSVRHLEWIGQLRRLMRQERERKAQAQQARPSLQAAQHSPEG
jgi:hypothetical protein